MKNFLCSLLLSACLASPCLTIAQPFSFPATQQPAYTLEKHNPADQRVKSKRTFKRYYVMFYGGWGYPHGSVSDIGGLVEFPSISADAIYEPGFAFGLIIGADTCGWLLEMSLEGRYPMPLI
ncbi:MAG: hypothetical protein ACE5IR_02645 [bacterium]